MLEVTASDGITQILDGRSFWDITEINNPFRLIVGMRMRLRFTHVLRVVTLALCVWVRVGVKVWRSGDVDKSVELCIIWSTHLAIVHSMDLGFGGHACLPHCRFDVERLSFRDERASVLVISAVHHPTSRRKRYVRETHLSKSDLLSVPAVLARFPQRIHHLDCLFDRKEVHERILLVPHHLDDIDIPKRPHFLRNLILAHLGINVRDIHRPRRIVPQDGVEHISTHPGLFSGHIDVEGVSSNGDFLDLGIGEESGCDGAV